MSVLVENKELREIMERNAARIRSVVNWHGTKIHDSKTSRITEPIRLATSEWWNDLVREIEGSAAELPKRGVFKCQGNRCEPLKQKRAFAQDTADVADEILEATKNDDARVWLADVSADIDPNGPGQIALLALRGAVDRAPAGARVRDLNPKLVKAALALFAQDDKHEEQKSLHLLEREDDDAAEWEKHIHPEADSREWLNKLADRFDLNTPGASGHWARLRDHVLRSATGSKVHELDAHLVKTSLQRLHEFRKHR